MPRKRFQSRFWHNLSIQVHDRLSLAYPPLLRSPRLQSDDRGHSCLMGIPKYVLHLSIYLDFRLSRILNTIDANR